MEFLSSNTMLMMEKSLGFLWTKQAAILDNVANAETPNYKAKVVTFEESLRDRLEAARRGPTPRQSVRKVLEEQAEVSVIEAQESARMDENGVNVTEQLTEMVRNSYQQQYMMSSISSDLAMLRTVVRGQ